MNSITLHKKILITLFLLLWGSIGWTQEPWCMVYDDLTLSERTALGISEQEWQDFQNLKTSSNSLNSNSIVPDNYPIVPKKNFGLNFRRCKIDMQPAGLYRVVLVCDNNVMESDNLIIQ